MEKQRGPGGGRARKGPVKVRGGKPVFRLRWCIPPAALAGGLLLLLVLRPRPVWYVAEDYQAHWRRIINEARPPFSRMEVLPPGGLPEESLGFVISSRGGPPGEKQEGAPVVLYPGLSRNREYGGALVLAVNPWMIFRKHQDPEPPRARIDSLSGGDGLLILPGADASAVHAWLTQLLQERPGNFAPDQALWERWKDEIFLNRRFQPGSVSYTWVEVWPLLFRNEVAWVYAPINRIRELSSYRMGLLDAARFPEPPSWNEYGLQADVLWAIPVGEEKHLKRLNKAAGWLKDPQTQTIIANEIEWIPAHPSGTPFNALTWETQIAWLRSSFVWQDPDEH